MASLGSRLLAAFLLLAASGLSARAQDALHGERPLPGERWIPSSSIGYVELTDPARLVAAVRAIVDEPLVRENPQLRQGLEQRPARDLLRAIEAVQSEMGLAWDEILLQSFARVQAGFDPITRQAWFIIEPRDEARLRELYDSLKKLVEAEATRRGESSPVKSYDLGGLEAYQLGEDLHYVWLQGRLVVANRRDALRAVQRLAKNADAPSLGASEAFAQARDLAGPDPTAWGYVRWDLVRALPPVAEALERQSDNIVTELAIGGLQEALQEAPILVLSAEIEAGRLVVHASAPVEYSKLAAARPWFFPSEPSEGAPAALPIPGSLGSIAWSRQISEAYVRRDELFDEKANAELAQADSGISLFLSGRDVEQEILGQMGRGLQLVFLPNPLPEDRPAPAVRVPAGAVIIDLKPGATLSEDLVIGFQKFVGLGNIVGGQNGRPQLLLTNGRHRDVELYLTRYRFPELKNSSESPPIEANFGPSCAAVGDRFVIASTEAALKTVIDALQSPGAAAPTSDNFRIDLRPDQLALALAPNRDLLLAQNRLTDGGTTEEAAARIAAIETLLKRGKSLVVHLETKPDRLGLEAVLEFAP
jgi:hypothetical protein